MAEHPFIQRLLPGLDELVRRASPVAVPHPAGLLVALSGGPDSVALLLLARAWARAAGAPLEAAHLNHLLRAAESDSDETFCSQLCARLGVPLHARRADPRPLARRRGLGPEEAGRRLRQRLLTDTLTARPHLGCAATGHHRDDQAETIVMRLFRGAGLDGLRGIRPVAGRIIHPLLGVDRREILAFLADVGEPYRRDETNETGASVRTRVRRELLPLARDIFGPGAQAVPARIAGLLTDDADLLERLARQARARVERPAANFPATAPAGAGPEAGPDLLGVPELLALDRPLARRVLRLHLAERWGLRRDLGQAHVDALLDWLSTGISGHAIDLPGGWRAEREFDRLRLFPPGTPAAMPDGGPLRILVLRAADQPPAGGDGPATWRLDCPAAAVRGEPRVRPWRPGDRIRLPGLAGHKKVSDLLRERRVPARRRGAVQIVEDDAGLLWVVGLARAERTLLLPGCVETITLLVTPSPAPPDGA